MMEVVRGYLLRLTAGAFLSAGLLALIPKGTSKKAAAVLCGLVMLLLALTPLAQLDYDALSEAISRLELEKEEARTGIEIRNQELVARIISGRVQAYILDKAASLGLTVTVELEMETRAAISKGRDDPRRGDSGTEAAASAISGADLRHSGAKAGMDAMSTLQLSQLRERAAQLLRKYRIPLLVFLLGVALALVPGKTKKTDAQQTTAASADTAFDLSATQKQLEALLSAIDGAGRVRLMLTLSSGEQIIYQTDSRTVTASGSTTQETQTVFRQLGGSEKEPAVQSTVYPTYQGALVVCDGAERASVRLAVTQAVSSLTGLGSNKIAVVKMKGQ